MDSRIEKAVQELKNNGWTLREVDQKFEWWIDRVFELNSTWRPVGASIYFMLDVDPDTTSGRKMGENIISVSVSKKVPTERLSAEKFTFYLSSLNDARIRDLIRKCNQLRDGVEPSPEE